MDQISTDGPPCVEWRPFASLRSETWTFDSPLTPDELRERLEASWDKPFRVRGKGAWGSYGISAVLQPHGWFFVRPRDADLFREFRHSRWSFRHTFGQRFSGVIKSTTGGSRLSGTVGVATPDLFGLIQFVLTTGIALAISIQIATAIFLFIGAAVFVYPDMFRARTRRVAIWKFLHAATRTPVGEKFVDNADNEMIKRFNGG